MWSLEFIAFLFSVRLLLCCRDIMIPDFMVFKINFSFTGISVENIFDKRHNPEYTKNSQNSYENNPIVKYMGKEI